MLQSTLIIPSVAHLLNDWVGTTLGVSILLVGAIMEAILAEGTFDQVSRIGVLYTLGCASHIVIETS